jgi:hypothetical protein
MILPIKTDFVMQKYCMEGNVQNKNPALAGLLFSGVFYTFRFHSLDACGFSQNSKAAQG